MNQISLFDIVPEAEKKEEIQSNNEDFIEVGDFVKVTKNLDESSMLAEDYYYLKDFSNKKGKVQEIRPNTKGERIYLVIFDREQFGYFYSKDLILI